MALAVCAVTVLSFAIKGILGFVQQTVLTGSLLPKMNISSEMVGTLINYTGIVACGVLVAILMVLLRISYRDKIKMDVILREPNSLAEN